MSESTTPERPTRAPNGCSAQLFISLTHAERDCLRDMAKREHRSASAQARMLIQRGLDSLKNDGRDDTSPAG